MKGAKDLFIVIDISRDIFVNVEKIDDKTLKKKNRKFLSLDSAVNVCILCLLAL